jgi:hypothetical protein
MERSWRVMLGFYTAWLTAFFLTAQSAAWAGPGGLIKAAVMTPLGRIGLLILAVIFSPFILYYLIKRAQQIRKTRKDLAKLTALYPQYRWLDVQDRATATFQWVWSAWGRQKMETASEFTTSWYMQNQQMLLDDWADRGLENVCRLTKIKTIEPLFVQHNEANNGQGSRLVVAISADVVDYMEDKATGKLVEGDKKVGDSSTVWTFVWQDDAWRLNLIQPDTTEMDYLKMPNELPASLMPESARS